MRKLALMLLLFIWGETSFGQNRLTETSIVNKPGLNYSYGLSPSINTSFFGKSDIYSASLGFGLEMFFDAHIPKTKFQGVSQLGFHMYNYQIPNEGTVVNSSNITLGLGLKRPLDFLDNSSLILKYSGHNLIAATSKYQGIKRPGPDEINLLNKVNNKISHGIYLGFDFDLKEKSSFELGYTFIVNKKLTNEYVDAVPNSLSLKYNIKFSEFVKSKSELQLARETVAQLANDTLYFINQSCEGELPNSQLDSLLKIHYQFSAYKILEADEIAKTRLQSNVVHFAVIGSYYAGEGEPTTSGIYLLDKNLNNTEAPYPNFKQLDIDFGINKKLCINDVNNAVFLINWLNSALTRF